MFDTIGDGNETVDGQRRVRHVNGYLQDFLFPPERARSPVKALSGGERNRLLLARLFTRPANVLVLDEPTNDLDLETLELLEAQLVELARARCCWSATTACSSTTWSPARWCSRARGSVQEYVGGYEDWLRQRPQPRDETAASQPREERSASAAEQAAADPARKRLSYNEQRELQLLPARIESLEEEKQRLAETIAAPEFYKETADRIAETLARNETVEEELNRAYGRWDELDSRA